VAAEHILHGCSECRATWTTTHSRLSGIWKGYNYKKTHYERLPYNQDDIKSIYHVRELDIRKLLQIRTQVDITVSHDWPRVSNGREIGGVV